MTRQGITITKRYRAAKETHRLAREAFLDSVNSSPMAALDHQRDTMIRTAAIAGELWDLLALIDGDQWGKLVDDGEQWKQ
jgi:hypothetical protein